MSKNPVAASVLAGLLLCACDTFHAVRSASRLATLPEAACVERVLSAQPDITHVIVSTRESPSFGLAPRWGPQTTYSSVWTYRTANLDLILQIVRDADGVNYSNGRMLLNGRIPEKEAAVMTPVISRVDAALIAECGLKPLKPLTVAHR